MDFEALKKLIEDLGRTFDAYKAANDERFQAIEEKGHVDPLLSSKIDKIDAELSNLTTQKAEIDRQLDALETTVARADLPGGQGRSELESARAAHKDAFNAWFREGVDANLRELEVQASLSSGSDPDGGYTVPEEVEAAIERVASIASAMRRLAMVRTIGTDTYKKLISQGGSTSGWVAEIEARPETTAPNLAQIAINAKEVYAMPAATQVLLDDSAIDIGGWLAEEVGIEFAEEESDGFINGDGTAEPRGILGYTPAANASYAWGNPGYIASGEAADFTDADVLIDLQHALKSVYRGGAAWLMNDATQAHVRKFKDGEGNYIWRPGLQEGVPATLLGQRVEIDDNMPDIAADVYPIAFANFQRAYLIIDRIGIRVLRDPYSSKPYVLFYTTKRVGGGIVNFEAIKLLKVAAS